MARSKQVIKLGEEYEPYLETYANLIKDIQQECKNEIKEAVEFDVGTSIDELFILRFVLSNNTMEECVTNVKKTLKWRMENKEKLQVIWNGGNPPHQHVVSRFQNFGWVGQMKDGHPINIVRMGLCDSKGLMNTLSQEEFTEYLTINSEVGFQRCDKASRATKKLIKVIVAVDLDRFSIFGGKIDLRLFKASGVSSHLNEIYYPQLTGMTCILNVPSTFQVMLKMFAPFQSKRSLEKQKCCPVQQIWKKDGNECPFLKRHMAVDQIPDFLGGTYPTPTSLLDIHERKDKTESIQVLSGKKGEIKLNITDPNTIVTYEFLSEGSSFLINAKIEDIEVLKDTTISASEGLYEGQFSCPISGELIITVDNSKNWTSRTLSYCLKVSR